MNYSESSMERYRSLKDNNSTPNKSSSSNKGDSNKKISYKSNTSSIKSGHRVSFNHWENDLDLAKQILRENNLLDKSYESNKINSGMNPGNFEQF